MFFNSKQKRPRSIEIDEDELDSDDGGYLTDQEQRERPKKRTFNHASSSRGDKTNALNRRATLEEDKWTKNVKAHELTCVGCKKRVKLRKDVPYAPRPWENHKRTCKNVKGEVSIQLYTPTMTYCYVDKRNPSILRPTCRQSYQSLYRHCPLPRCTFHQQFFAPFHERTTYIRPS